MQQTTVPLPQMLETIFLGGALNFLGAVLILIVGWVVARYVARLVHSGVSRIRAIDATLTPLISATVRYAILGITLMAVLERFGVQTTSIIAVLGAAGLAIGLALQGTLSNVASGVMLLLLRPIRVRERISVQGVTGITGTVREVGLFRTVLIADDGEYISVPNAMIFSGAIVNTSREPTRRINFTFTVDHDANIGRVLDIVRSILHKDSRILKNPAPDVLVDSTSDIGINILVLAWVLSPNYGQANSDTKKAVRENLLAAKVPLPQRIVTVNGPAQGAADDALEEAPKRQRSA